MAQNSVQQSRLYTVDQSYNIRRGPGTEHDRVAVVRPGERLEVVGESQDWLVVRFRDGQMGYIAARGARPLARTGRQSQSPSGGPPLPPPRPSGERPLTSSRPVESQSSATVEPSSSSRSPGAEVQSPSGPSGQEIPPAQVDGPTRRAEVTGPYRFRSRPEGTVLGILRPGQEVEVIGRDGDWLEVQTPDGRRGFVFGEGVRGGGAEGGEPASQESPSAGASSPAAGRGSFGAEAREPTSPEPAPSSGAGSEAQSGRAASVPLPPPRPAGLTPQASPEAREALEIEPAMLVSPFNQTVSGRYNFRASPGGQIQGTLTPESRFRVVAERQEWIEVETEDGRRGFVHQQGVVPCENTPVTPASLVDESRNILERAYDNLAESYQRYRYRQFKQFYEHHSLNRCLDRVMRGGIPAGRNRCFVAVKRGLQSAGLVDKYLNGNSASMGRQVLRDEGFIDLLTRFPRAGITPENAPVGSVLVYRGPWDPIDRSDPRIQGGQIRQCPGNPSAQGVRNRWREGCWFTESDGRSYIYRNTYVGRNGRRYPCPGAGTQHGHIEVRTSRGFSHYLESRHAISEIGNIPPQCRVLTGIMVDPSLEAPEEEPKRCPV